MKKILLLLLYFQLFGSAYSDVKTWTKNTNFDEPENWSGGGIFCSNDKKVFPKDLRASIFVQKNESLQELVLSDNMILSIGEGVVLTFDHQVRVIDGAHADAPSAAKRPATSSVSQASTTPAPSCTRLGRKVEFTATSSSWFNPDSWSTPQTEPEDSKRFMMDMESVPCSEDRVVFPSENTFLVDTELSPLKTGAMLLHNVEYATQPSFNRYWSGDLASYEFMNRSGDIPAISGKPCGDDKTCPCKDRYSGRMRMLVCKYITCDDKKVMSDCKAPILPTYGHCCQLCGSKLLLSVNSIETPSLLYQLHMQLLSGLKNWNNVQYSLGPEINYTMEIILRDKNESGNAASQAACELRDLLLKNETATTLGIKSIKFERSDGIETCINKAGTTLPSRPATPPSPKWDSIIIGGSLAFTVVGVILVCVGIYLYRKKYGGNFKNEMELGNVSNRSSQGFDNPVYDTPLPFEDSFIVSYDSAGDQVNGFENAIYTPGTDSGVSVHSPEKKAPLEDPYAPVVKKPKKKAATNGKKQKASKNVGFDNPVYSMRKEKEEGAGSMDSVPLDEDDADLPAYVEHDGTGYANPIATGLSEEMMAPSLPKKTTIPTLEADAGFNNPLYSGEGDRGIETMGADVGEVTVHVAEPTKKKKKGKNGKTKDVKSKNGGVKEKKQGFDNPLYGQDSNQQEYQPETPGEDKSKLPSDEDGL